MTHSGEVMIFQLNSDQAENVICNVNIDPDAIKDTRESCYQCTKKCELEYKVVRDGQLRNICSEECLKKENSNHLEAIGLCFSCSKPLTKDFQNYVPNFGSDQAVLCSERCLLKYESENEPVPRCFKCKKAIEKTDDKQCSFYWQTMEFCSVACVENLQFTWGRKCTSCQTIVPYASLGKYSVRFGNIIRQFCAANCLDRYKKTLEVCLFCQMDLQQDRKSKREFCDAFCMQQYRQLITIRGSNPIASNREMFSDEQCEQCFKFTDKLTRLILIEPGAQKPVYICSSLCLAAYKHVHNQRKALCELCFKFISMPRGLTILHHVGQTKLFCSKRCLNMYVFRTRRIIPCMCCSVKKYNFDLIEKFDSRISESKLFCSVYCISFASDPTINMIKDNQTVKCCTCQNVVKVRYQVTLTNGTKKNFCSHNCVSSYQANFSDSLPNPSKSSELNGPLSSGPSSSLLSSTTMSVPSLTLNGSSLKNREEPRYLMDMGIGGLKQVNSKFGNTIHVKPISSPLVKGATNTAGMINKPNISQIGSAIQMPIKNPQLSTSSIVINSPESQYRGRLRSPMILGSGNNMILIDGQKNPQNRFNEIGSSNNSTDVDTAPKVVLSIKKPQANKMTIARVPTRTKSTICKPMVSEQETQTEEGDSDLSEDLARGIRHRIVTIEDVSEIGKEFERPAPKRKPSKCYRNSGVQTASLRDQLMELFKQDAESIVEEISEESDVESTVKIITKFIPIPIPVPIPFPVLLPQFVHCPKILPIPAPVPIPLPEFIVKQMLDKFAKGSVDEVTVSKKSTGEETSLSNAESSEEKNGDDHVHDESEICKTEPLLNGVRRTRASIAAQQSHLSSPDTTVKRRRNTSTDKTVDSIKDDKKRTKIK